MSSIKEFVSRVLEPAIVKDAKEFRIFNEADLQACVASHLQRKYINDHPNLYLLNQPSIRIGRGRGAERARPDLVVCDFDDGPNPLAAFELKCYLEDADKKLPDIQSKIWDDISALRKFGQRFSRTGTEHVFIIALLDVTDEGSFRVLDSDFRKNREEWMSHFLKVHLINMRTQIRRGYNQWAEHWLDLQFKM